MRVPAAFSTAARPVLNGPIRPAQWLGAGPSALYVSTHPGTVLAIVTHDAVRLPLALVVSSTAAELPLSGLVPEPDARHGAPVAIGAGGVEWTGPMGVVTVAGVREWAPARVVAGRPWPGAVDVLKGEATSHDIGVDLELMAALALAGDPVQQRSTVAALLGRGPGLTPSGDDVLAGFLLGARAFRLPVPGVATAVTELASGATSALSAQLLVHAVRGECIPEFAAVVDALCGRQAPLDATARLLAVGHTSGAALALGLLAAAAHAQVPLTTRAAP